MPITLGVLAAYAADHVTVEVMSVDAGDCNDDDIIDLIDHACLADCLLGPGQALMPGCDRFDFDSSSAVDLIDYARFAAGLGND